jgi:hypothetical protein
MFDASGIIAETCWPDLAHYKESDWIPAIISVKRRSASMKDVTVDLIHTDLETIKRKLMKIKEYMVDRDSIMTEGDHKVLQAYTIEKLNED